MFSTLQYLKSDTVLVLTYWYGDHGLASTNLSCLSDARPLGLIIRNTLSTCIFYPESTGTGARSSAIVASY
jgi:hypothetical protein